MQANDPDYFDEMQAQRLHLVRLRAVGHSVAAAVISPLAAGTQAGTIPGAAAAASGQWIADRIGVGASAALARR